MRTTKAATHPGRGRAEDLAVATLAGYLGTKVMEPVSRKLYELESADDRAREDHARPGPPYRVAAQKTAHLCSASTRPSSSSTRPRWRSTTGWPSPGRLTCIPAGLVRGTAMNLVDDETITPAPGFSAPNRAYPLSTHLRGLAAHLAFGLAVAAATEAAWYLHGRRP